MENNTNNIIDRNSPIPLYYQLKELLKNKIINTRLTAGTKLPSMRELMKEHGLNLLTVKQAIDELVKEDLVYCKQSKGIFVTRDSIVNVREKRIKKIALIADDLNFISNLYCKEVIESIHDVMNNSGKQYKLMFFSSEHKYSKYSEYPYYLNPVNNKNLDGFLIMDDLGNSDKKRINDIINIKLPFVLMCQPVQNMELNFVVQDDFRGAYEGTKYLISLGHKRIGLITGPFFRRGVKEFLKGYKYALSEAKLEYNDELVKEGDFREYKGYLIAKELLELKPTAIFAGSDYMAMGVIHAINEKKLKIPDDISVIGFNDKIEDAEMKNFLTTLRVSTKELGKLAINILLEIINGKETNTQNIYLEPRLIIRKSTGPAPNCKI